LKAGAGASLLAHLIQPVFNAKAQRSQGARLEKLKSQKTNSERRKHRTSKQRIEPRNTARQKETKAAKNLRCLRGLLFKEILPAVGGAKKMDCWIVGLLAVVPILIIIANRQATVNSTQRRKGATPQPACGHLLPRGGEGWDEGATCFFRRAESHGSTSTRMGGQKTFNIQHSTSNVEWPRKVGKTRGTGIQCKDAKGQGRNCSGGRLVCRGGRHPAAWNEGLLLFSLALKIFSAFRFLILKFPLFAFPLSGFLFLLSAF
jgi:hypothetical protein